MDNKTKYHTISHIALSVIKEMYGDSAEWKGGNMDEERLRFDFALDHKMTDEEKEELVNNINHYIDMDLPVVKEEMPLAKAREIGAHGTFDYGDVVSVYKIGDVSLEICGGPHVSNTRELGTFRIVKEEASSAGVRRIKAVLE